MAACTGRNAVFKHRPSGVGASVPDRINDWRPPEDGFQGDEVCVGNVRRTPQQGERDVKNTYTITAKVADRTVLADLLDASEGYATSVEVAVANSAPKAAPAPAPAPVKAASKPARAKRNPKRSKVNDTIRESLRRGPTT